MKFLIWLICIIVYSSLTTLLSMGGASLGAIPTCILFFLTVWLANALSKNWDEYRESKKTKKTTQKEEQNENNEVRNCWNCKEPLIENSNFCRKCGVKIVEEEA